MPTIETPLGSARPDGAVEREIARAIRVLLSEDVGDELFIRMERSLVVKDGERVAGLAWPKEKGITAPAGGFVLGEDGSLHLWVKANEKNRRDLAAFGGMANAAVSAWSRVRGHDVDVKFLDGKILQDAIDLLRTLTFRNIRLDNLIDPLFVSRTGRFPESFDDSGPLAAALCGGAVWVVAPELAVDAVNPIEVIYDAIGLILPAAGVRPLISIRGWEDLANSMVVGFTAEVNTSHDQEVIVIPRSMASSTSALAAALQPDLYPKAKLVGDRVVVASDDGVSVVVNRRLVHVVSMDELISILSRLRDAAPWMEFAIAGG